MPLPTPRTLGDFKVEMFSSNGGASTGILHRPVVVQKRSRVIECGYSPDSLMAAATVMSLAVILYSGGASGASTQLIASTAAGFSVTSTSTAPGAVHSLEHGQVYSAVPPSPAYVNAGDALGFVTSGGNSSAIGITCYAILRPA
jgi:hypothetical protein